MAGLFVQKHADAVRAQGLDVRVIHSQSLHDTWRQWRVLQRNGWWPDIVQLNVIQKQGVLALWLKKHFHIPYLIIEHWSGYLPENGQFMRMSALKRRLYMHIATEAEIVLTVSTSLQRAMQTCGIQAKHWGHIDNVVDDFFFENCQETQKRELKTLLHVSCFDEQAKNVSGLLRAFRVACLRRNDIRLVLVGTGMDIKVAQDLADELEFPKGTILFTGEQTPREVCRWLHRADAFVLSSRYETYGVVLAEAAAAGVPILSTPVGIAEQLPALIVSQEIARNHPDTFAEFLDAVLEKPIAAPKQNTEDSYPHFAQRFSANTIGKKLKDLYDSCLHHNI